MKILSFDTLSSTQEYLKELVGVKNSVTPLAVTCNVQTHGIGSRDNSWQGFSGNLFVSFALPLEELPDDLKIESASIYFAYILKETLESLNSKIWLKWPNDFYVDDKKVGGMITNLVGNNIVCGFGLNLCKAPEGFGLLDIQVDKENLLKIYFLNLKEKVLWKQVFSKYELEFYRNRSFSTHIKNKKIYLNEATLESDGSLNINGKRMYSLR